MKILSRKTRSASLEWYMAAKNEGAVLLIDKEISWTSFDVVARLRNVLKIGKVGHAGTLDPLASGLLLLCCGKATKRAAEFQDMTKEYRTTLKLGATTATYDSEAEEENICDVSGLSVESIISTIESFTGELEQVPPMFSAVKVQGKRLYQIARKGLTVERAPRTITIYSISAPELDLPFVSFTVTCSKGTYIRSLAHDIGQKLGCGAYMFSLRRTKIGDFDVDDALSVHDADTEIKNAKNAELALINENTNEKTALENMMTE